jgi:membrane protease YdiL (CAAX protease family)
LLVRRGAEPDERALAVLNFLALGLVLLVRGRRAGVDWRRLFGGPIDRATLPLVAVIVPVALLMFGGFYLVYVPLSYVWPWVVVHYGLLEPDLFRITTLGEWVEMMLVGAVVAPIVEETLFRGILMQRWARRWDTFTGVVASSALFALAHQEILGHFVFAVAMCALYLRTRRLWVPIAAHALNNAILMMPELWRVLRHGTGSDEPHTIASLRAGWPEASLAFVAGGVLLWLYLRYYWPGTMLSDTLRGPVPYADTPRHDLATQAASPTGAPVSTSTS